MPEQLKLSSFVTDSEPAPPPAFEWASFGIYHLSEMREAFVDTMARFFVKRRGCKRSPFAQRLVLCKGGSSGFAERDLARGRRIRVHGNALLRNSRWAESSMSLA